MARVKLSPIISELNGSIGQSTFQRSLGGVMLRNKPIRKPKNTTSQQISQSYMSSVISAWKNLSDAQRLVWQQYSDYTPTLLKFNKTRRLKGYNLFVKYNMLRLQAGLSILSDGTFAVADPLSYVPEIQTVNENFFVTVGQGTNSIAWSDDGINWTGIGTSIFSSNGRAVTWSGSLYVAVGQGTNSLAWSSDGKIWTGLGTSIFTNYGLSICWNGSIFIAGGNGTNSLAWSSDGKIWNGLGTSVFSGECRSLTWNGSKFVAVGSGANSIAWSSDGINWTGLGTSIFNTQGDSVAASNNLFVAIGASTNTIAYSYDGVNWLGLGNSIFTAQGRSICWDGSKFVAVGQGTNSLAWSSDGINWTGLGTSIFSTNGRGICWNGSKFVAVGSGTNTIAWSSDGINWNGLGSSIFSSSGINCVSLSRPSVFPVILHPILFDFNACCATDNKWFVLALSNSRPITENFKPNTTRVIVIPFAVGQAHNIEDQLYAIFGTNPFSDDILNCSLTIFATDVSKIFPTAKERFTIVAT